MHSRSHLISTAIPRLPRDCVDACETPGRDVLKPLWQPHALVKSEVACLG